jgi:GNAT superfamily N-acetyltransferase
VSKTAFNVDIQEFQPKEASAEQWARVHKYRRERLAEADRLDQLFPDKDYETMAKRDDPFGKSRRYFVEHNGEIISGFHTYLPFPDSPGYESNKHLLNADLAVLTPHRRKGIGTALLRQALSLMEENDKSVLTLGTEEDDGHAFLKAIGAQPKLEGAENRLALNEVDWDMVARWVKEGREGNPDTEFVFYENRIPEEHLAEIAPVFTELLNTMPFDDLDHGDIVMTPELFKEWYDQMDQLKIDHHIYMTKEPDGAISGMTDVSWAPQTAERITQNFTGVRPEHRGRGLGKWLKAAMLEYIRGRYPQVEFVSTGNANSNDPMLAINRKLGFKTHKGGTSYQISREDVAKYLASAS